MMTITTDKNGTAIIAISGNLKMFLIPEKTPEFDNVDNRWDTIFIAFTNRDGNIFYEKNVRLKLNEKNIRKYMFKNRRKIIKGLLGHDSTPHMFK